MAFLQLTIRAAGKAYQEQRDCVWEHSAHCLRALNVHPEYHIRPSGQRICHLRKTLQLRIHTS